MKPSVLFPIRRLIVGSRLPLAADVLALAIARFQLLREADAQFINANGATVPLPPQSIDFDQAETAVSLCALAFHNARAVPAPRSFIDESILIGVEDVLVPYRRGLLESYLLSSVVQVFSREPGCNPNIAHLAVSVGLLVPIDVSRRVCKAQGALTVGQAMHDAYPEANPSDPQRFLMNGHLTRTGIVAETICVALAQISGMK